MTPKSTHFPSVLLFDFGGVLARFRGIEALESWSRHASSADANPERDLWAYWLSSETVRAFETGELDAPDFARQLRAELSLDISEEALLDDLRGWVPHLLPGAIEALTELSETHRLALLSNTNSVHWPLYEAQMEPLFERTFLSYQTGFLKPDPVAFENCAHKLGCAPENIHFFDDSPINVESARESGYQATVATSPSDCLRTVASFSGC